MLCSQSLLTPTELSFKLHLERYKILYVGFKLGNVHKIVNQLSRIFPFEITNMETFWVRLDEITMEICPGPTPDISVVVYDFLKCCLFHDI